ncbi:MAG: glutamine--fructose-6-phosphate transaminase (isomerizing) [Rickettsiales bacterium]|nr:glutamine--fructose-6-phosphate transaminase (isomerizing) [Rickettsiales bacterium]
MCGIVGIVGTSEVSSRLLEALKKLEYRGYDSAGIATLDGGEIKRTRASGKLNNLEAALREEPLAGGVGIGHTRWATHGAPTKENAHPHVTDSVAVVHNGIIENHAQLREELKAQGAVFTSETDTEVITHLLSHLVKEGKAPEVALKEALTRLDGAYAIGVLFQSEPDALYAARWGSPLAVGVCDGEMAVGSDAIALSLFTNRVIYLEEGDWAKLTPTSMAIFNNQGHEVVRPEVLSGVASEAITKGGYRHFMEKEIHEQPEAIAKTLEHLRHPTLGSFTLPDLNIDVKDLRHIVIIACGTSYYAGMVAQYWLEDLTGLPVSIDIASEFRYRTPRLSEGVLALFISQSGETADTLAALRMIKEMGHPTLAIVNMQGSSMEREADAILHTQAGPEIGVASTKAFTTQLTILAGLAIELGENRQVLSADQVANYWKLLEGLPSLMREATHHVTAESPACQSLMKAYDVLYLGRGTSYPLAMEGALKLKEISYIHAEGYAAGEMKHGPIALIDERVPIIVIAPNDKWQEKTLSNMQEARARGGKIILISDEAGIKVNASQAHFAVTMPNCDAFVAPFVYSVPIQMLAYYTAVLKGTDVDQPRNLAKSVTVE